MKKIVILTCFFALFSTLKADATWGSGYKYYDGGGIYAGTKFPRTVAKDINANDSKIEIQTLKKGVSSSRNFFKLVEIGNASITKAAKDGNITKIHYVDTQINKVYVPFFIPIYAKETKTIVYGE